MQHSVRTLRGALCGVALFLVGAQAAAADTGKSPTEAERAALGTHQKHVRVELGDRTQFINSKGFDPFSKNDALSQVTLGASFAFWTREQLSLAVLAGFDYGGSSAAVRSDQAELDLHRFILAPEARYHVLRVLALTLKVGPTLTREHAELRGGLDSALSKTAWRFGFDATAGAAVEVFGFQSGASHKPRAWLVAEGGYGWTAPVSLSLKAQEAGAVPQRLTPVDLGDLSLSGPLFRISAAVSFW